MSLNKLTNIQKGLDIKLQIGCEQLESNVINCGQLNMSNGTDINAYNITIENELKVNGSTDLGGNNYITPDLGLPNYSLHTDGFGNCFWSPDATGDDNITYNGIPPTIVGQFVKFSDVDGKTAQQSTIRDDGGNLNMGSGDITNVGSISTDEIKEPTSTLSRIVLDNSKQVNIFVKDSGDIERLRLGLNTLQSVFNSPNAVNSLNLTDNAFTLNMSGQKINLVSSSSQFLFNNDGVIASTNDVILRKGGIGRVIVSGSETYLAPPNNAGYFYIDDSSSSIYVDEDNGNYSELNIGGLGMTYQIQAGTIRQRINTTESQLNAPNGDGFIAKDTELQLSKGGVKRIEANNTLSILRSPN